MHIVLPLPRFVFNPLTLVAIAAVHVYLSVEHLSHLVAGEIEWTHIWKGFGALIGVYVFAALAARGFAVRRPSSLVGSTSEG
jgi:hypothetical protein